MIASVCRRVAGPNHFEWNLVVAKSFGKQLSHLGNQVKKAHFRSRFRAQSDGVQEVAKETLHFAVLSSCRSECPDEDAFLSRVGMEQGCEARKQDHKQRCTGFTAKLS